MRRPPPEDINLAGGRLLTQEEAARALGKSIKTIYRMRNSGQLAYIPGSPVTIPERALVQYLEGATICRDKTRGRTSRKSPTSTDTLKSCGQKIARAHVCTTVTNYQHVCRTHHEKN